MSITWDEIDNKYPEDRDEMSEEREKAYVNDCFDCYEHEGFSKNSGVLLVIIKNGLDSTLQ